MIRITKDKSILQNKSITFVDMHHHSIYSDGTKSPAFLAKLSKKHKIGIAIADHNQIKGSLYLLNQKDVFTIPAIEVTTKQIKDFLAYFYTKSDLTSFWQKEIRPHLKNRLFLNSNHIPIDTIDLLDKIKNYNGITALPHPLTTFKNTYNYLKNPFFLKKLDAIESHNFMTGKYKKTLIKISPFEKPLTAGSDSHGITSFNTLTGSYSSNIHDFIDSILKRKNIIYAKDNPNLRFKESLRFIKSKITNWHKVKKIRKELLS